MGESSNRDQRKSKPIARITEETAVPPDEILDGDELVRRLFESSPPMAGDSEESLEMQREMMEQWAREAEQEEMAESEATEGET